MASRMCPYCKERIKREALICRYCQREVEPVPHRGNPWPMGIFLGLIALSAAGALSFLAGYYRERCRWKAESIGMEEGESD
jgi:hypothetical protein